MPWLLAHVTLPHQEVRIFYSRYDILCQCLRGQMKRRDLRWFYAQCAKFSHGINVSQELTLCFIRWDFLFGRGELSKAFQLTAKPPGEIKQSVGCCLHGFSSLIRTRYWANWSIIREAKGFLLCIGRAFSAIQV